MAVKLLALDMDGTTLMNDHYTVSKRNQQAIKWAIAQGIEFVPATGRTITHLPKDILNLKNWRYAITSNGAFVYDRQQDKVIYSDFLDIHLVLQMIRELKKLELFFEVYINGTSFIEKHYLEHAQRYHITEQSQLFLREKCNQIENIFDFLLKENIHVEKIFVPYIPDEIHPQVTQMFLQFPVALTSSVDTNIEVNNQTANKGEALKYLAKQLQIIPDEIMAVGDSNNDYEMLEYAGISVAMGNGNEKVKKIAKFQTLSNEQDGVAHIIETLVLHCELE